MSNIDISEIKVPHLTYTSQRIWHHADAGDDGCPGHPGANVEIEISGMNRNSTQYVGTDNIHTLVIPTDPSNPMGSVLALDDPITRNQFGQLGQPFLVGIDTIILAGPGNAVIDLSSPIFEYGPITIRGGDGNYTLAGNCGHETYLLGDGTDIMYLHENGNVVRAGDGDNDRVQVGDHANHNHIRLGNGDHDTELLISGDGNSLALGNGTGDSITVDAGNCNRLSAGDGDHANLTAGQGDHNRLHAGDGAGDSLTVGSGSGNHLSAGEGAGDSLTVGSGSGNHLSAGDGAGDSLTIGSGSGNHLSAGDGAGDSLTIGSGNHNRLCAGDGAGDSLTIGSGNSNILQVGDGDGDSVTLGAGNGNRLVLGDGGGDHATIGAGNHNVIWGGDGDNAVLQIGDGSDNVIYGGDRPFAHNSGWGDDDGRNDTLMVGAGNDNRIYAADGDHDILVLGNGDHNLAAAGDGNNDWIYGGGGNGNCLIGGAGQDTIVGGDGQDNLLIGGAGDDTIFTGTGNDTVYAGCGTDFIVSGAHTATSNLADPFHLASQDGEAQHLYGGGGNDVFVVAGADTVASPGSGTPHTGTEVISGGTGADEFYFAGIWGHAVITDFDADKGDRILLGGVFNSTDGSGHLDGMAPNHFEYVHSAYSNDPNSDDRDDLLILIGGASPNDPYAQARSITLVDFRDQDHGGSGGQARFDNVSYNDPAHQQDVLSQLLDFNQQDHQAITAHDLNIPHHFTFG